MWFFCPTGFICGVGRQNLGTTHHPPSRAPGKWQKTRSEGGFRTGWAKRKGNGIPVESFAYMWVARSDVPPGKSVANDIDVVSIREFYRVPLPTAHKEQCVKRHLEFRAGAEEGGTNSLCSSCSRSAEVSRELERKFKRTDVECALRITKSLKEDSPFQSKLIDMRYSDPGSSSPSTPLCADRPSAF